MEAHGMVLLVFGEAQRNRVAGVSIYASDCVFLGAASFQVLEFMNVEKAIADLRFQLEMVNQVIITFERLAATRKPRRGRPRKWLKKTRSRLNQLPERQEKRT
jgi:hypothetical protein